MEKKGGEGKERKRKMRIEEKDENGGEEKEWWRRIRK